MRLAKRFGASVSMACWLLRRRWELPEKNSGSTKCLQKTFTAILFEIIAIKSMRASVGACTLGERSQKLKTLAFPSLFLEFYAHAN